MDELTLKFIYALKGDKYDEPTLYDKAVAFMSDYTGTPREHYFSRIIQNIAERCFIDLVKNARNPSYQVWDFFEHLKREDDTLDALLTTLHLVQVRDQDENGNYHYINGFRDDK